MNDVNDEYSTFMHTKVKEREYFCDIFKCKPMSCVLWLTY